MHRGTGACNSLHSPISQSIINMSADIKSTSSRSAHSTSTDEDPHEWVPLVSNHLDAAPATHLVGESERSPQTARDMEYAVAVQDAWRQQIAQRMASNARSSEITSIIYHDDQKTPLYGELVRRRRPRHDSSSSSSSTPATSSGSHSSGVPGIILFHTGAGPHDIFLQWKADELVTHHPSFLSEGGDEGCVVLIADMLSDNTGWAWSSDRSKYNSARKDLLACGKEDGGVRPTLQRRIRAALDVLEQHPGVDSNRIAAMGWCLGGHAILELGRMSVPTVRAMVTFHGVFDGVPAPSPLSIFTNDDDDDLVLVGSDHTGSNVLICNGVEDPFVTRSDLEKAVATLSYYCDTVKVLSLEGSRHGFTNPGQDSSENIAFGYNDDGARKSWNSALSLLHFAFAKGGPNNA